MSKSQKSGKKKVITSNMSLKKQILEYLKVKKDWVHKGELGRKAVLEFGFENENMGRRCRELENAGVIERKLEKNPKTGVWEAWYRIKGFTIMATTPYCCYSKYKFNVCSQDCIKNKVTNNKLF